MDKKINESTKQVKKDIAPYVIEDNVKLLVEIDAIKNKIFDKKNKKNENFYQYILEKYYKCGHTKYKTGVTDLTCSEFNGEIKLWIDYKYVVGQLLIANIHMKRDKMIAFMFGEYGDKSKQNAYDDFKSIGIHVYDLYIEDTNVYMKNMETLEVTKIY